MNLLISFELVFFPLFVLGNEWIYNRNEIEDINIELNQILNKDKRFIRRSRSIEWDPERILFGQLFGRFQHRRQKRDGDTAPPPEDPNQPPEAPPPADEPRPDEVAADDYGKAGGSGGGDITGGGYPIFVTPNVTCITADDLKHRIRSLVIEFGVKKTKKCPKALPCKEYLSCPIWRTGFVTKQFSIDKAAASTFYTALFEMLHGNKISDITRVLSECIAYYGLDEPFVNKENKDQNGDDGHGGAKKKKKKIHKGLSRKRREAEADTAGGTDSGNDPTPSKNETPNSESEANPEEPGPKFGLQDCRTRVDDFFECFDSIMLKGLCYWAPKDLA